MSLDRFISFVYKHSLEGSVQNQNVNFFFGNDIWTLCILYPTLTRYKAHLKFGMRMGIQIITLEGQTIQWSKEKGQKGKQRSTKHTHKTEDRVTRTLLKTGSKLGCSGRVGSSCSTRYFYSWIFIVLYIAHWNTVHRIKKECDSTVMVSFKFFLFAFSFFHQLIEMT
jgi:hypothetical protein